MSMVYKYDTVAYAWNDEFWCARIIHMFDWMMSAHTYWCHLRIKKCLFGAFLTLRLITTRTGPYHVQLAFSRKQYIYIYCLRENDNCIYIYVFEVRYEGVIHFAVCKFIDYMSQVLGYVKYIRNHETGFHCTWSRLLHTEGFHLCQVVGLYYTYIDGADVEHIIIVSE